MSHSPRTKKIAMIAGFSLGTGLVGTRASASVTLEATAEGTTDETTGLASESASVSITTAITTVAVIVLVVWLITRDGSAPGEALEGPSDAAPRSPTRLLLDSGLLVARGNLGSEVTLLLESPAAFDQLDDELQRGEGPTLRSLSDSTGMDIPSLQAAWATATATHGPVLDRPSASRLLVGFVETLAPDLKPSARSAAELVWLLHTERTSMTAAGTPTGEAIGHLWLAHWLGVPAQGVERATQAAFEDLHELTEAERRARVHAQPDVFLNAIAHNIEAHHADLIQVRILALSDAASSWKESAFADVRLAE